MRNIIYLVELQGATDISNLKIDGKEPEFITDKNKLSTIKFASKTMIIDLRANGWKAEKAEGIAMLPDGKTIAVASDNDFGIAIDVQDSENQDTEILDYTLYPDGSLKYNNKVAKPVFRIVPNPDTVENETQLWLIKLPETLK